MEDKVLVMLLVIYFDVGVFRVDAKRKVGWEGPWGGCPCEKGGLAIVDEWERNSD